MTLTAQSELGNAVVEVPARYAGRARTAKFNPVVLLEGIEAEESFDGSWQQTGARTPLGLSGAEDRVGCLIMPLI